MNTQKTIDTELGRIMEDSAVLPLFDEYCAFNPEIIVLLDEVRDMCAANRCGMYGKNWACPPGCGTLPEIKARIHAYDHGIIVQTVARLEDDFDFEGMVEAEKHNKTNFENLVDELRQMPQIESCMPLGAGTCTLCKECTYPDNPCRQPERSHSSLEAAGVQVSDLCRDAGIPYYHGRGTVSYTGCVLIRFKKSKETV
ncbi:MAG: DUF2284 domain-containing protein [Eubacteriaceae bacterium]|jgi:predicted metal-binding protein